MKGKKLALLLSAIIGLTPIVSFAEGLGVCTHVNKGYNHYANLEVVENAGIKWIRDECVWDLVETEKGVFSIPERIKRYYKTAKENGVNTLLILNYGNDAYTLSDGTQATTITMPSTDETEYMNGWKQYIRTVVEEIGDYVDVYEVWNEPDQMFANSLITSDDMDDYSKPAEVYVDLYINTKELLDELQPGKPVLFGCKCTGADSDNTIAFYDEMKSVAEDNGKTFNDYVEDVSIHFYMNNVSDAATRLSDWEATFDSYGFTGDVWLTETGLSVTDEDEYKQEAYLPMIALDFDRYLKENNREGVAFWYDLRNDGTDSTDTESNFGIVDYNYEMKDAFYAMQGRNKAVNYMSLTSYSTPQTGTGILGLTNEYGVLGIYSDGINTTYAGYDDNENNSTVSVALSGTKAYVYDYMGNVTATLDPSTTSTYDMPLGKNMTYVACVNPRTYINYVNYDELRGIVTVSGEASELDAATLGILIKDSSGNTVCTETVPVSNGKFETEISLSLSGTYTVTAGEDITTNYASEAVTIADDEGVMLGDSTVTISGDTVTVTGIVNNAEDGEIVSVLVVPQTTDLENLIAENIAYVDDTEISDGAYSVTFTMPENSEGIYKVLLSGTSLDNSDIKEAVGYGTASEYVNVCNFTYIPQETTTETTTDYEEVWSENFNTPSDLKIYTSSDELITLEIDPTTYGLDSYANTRQTYLATEGENDYSWTLTHTAYSHARLYFDKIYTEGKYKLEFDWQTNCSTDDGSKSQVRILDGTGDYWRITGAAQRLPSVSGGDNGTTAFNVNTWYHSEFIYDLSTGVGSITIYDSNGNVFIQWNNVSYGNLTTGGFKGIAMDAVAGGAKLDNIVLSKEVTKEVTIEGDTLQVSAQLNNPSSSAKECTIIIAQYDEDGRLAYVDSSTVTVEANTVQPVVKSVSSVINSNATTAKGFIYDGLATIRPLVNGLQIPINSN